jgi:hypothetical protein
MEPENSLPYAQQPATCPYPEPDQSSPCPPIPLLEDPFWNLRVIFTVHFDSFSSIISNKFQKFLTTLMF